MKSRMLFFLLFVAFASYAQTGIIKGRVVDSKTFKPLPFASVYINQTTLGTVTNDEGDFIMQHIPAGKYELVVSYLGYQSYQSRITVNDSIPVSMSVKMIASTTNLEEVLVQAKKDEQWDNLYQKFHKQFFGTSDYTGECKILNPWVLEFNEDNKGMLNAKASLPIEIENMGLGYKISFTLKEFSAGDKVYKIAGTYRFTEAATIDTTLSALWDRRREEVYHGSPRHLFKAIIDNRVAEEGFDMFTDISNTAEVIRNTGFLTNIDVSLKPLQTTGIIERGNSDGQYVIKLPKRVEIHYVLRHSAPKVYRNIPHPVSWIESSAPIEVNSSGIVLNPNRMVVLGAMSEARVAEVLPLDYTPDKKTRKTTRKSNSSLASLMEKPYLAIDKPYYYPSDAILFKAFFNYVTPAYRDSLSHVMRVELINASHQIIDSKLFPVSDGSAFGNITLPPNIQPGDYILRAYTRWMLNFDKQLIFTRSLKILSPEQFAKPTDIKPISKQLKISTDKDEYATREKITVALETFNGELKPVAADLVVSVTDLEQAVVPANEKNILNDFAITQEMLPDTSLKNPKYLIQYGIDLKGQMISGKKNRNTNGILTIYQDNVNDVFAVATDGDGKFHQEIQLMDSIDLLIAAKNSKGQDASIVIDDTKDPIPSIGPASPLTLGIDKTSDPSKYHRIDHYSTTKMLETVTVEANRMQRLPTEKHLIVDRRIDGETLRATNAVDLLTALQGRMAGLQILYTTDITGTLRKLIGFTQAGKGKFLECMVVINGAIVPTGGSETMAERLAAMTVHEVESVEVLRHGSASIYGIRSANGVIIIKLRMDNKSTNASHRPDRSKLQVVNLDGYSKANEFKSPDYSEHINGDDRGDYRSTIYWNPHAATDGAEVLTLSFYAADIPTKYRVVVEGVTANGEAVHGEKIIVVTGKK